MKIRAVRARNFKGLREVAFAPGPHAFVVCGGNGHGKSSVIDAILATLCGASASPAKPVRDGEARADCTVTLEDGLRVTRRWTADGETALYVEAADGSRPRKPQSLLDGLFAAVAFDPLAFSRMKPKDRVETLRGLAGLAEAFDRIDARRAELAEERTEVNRAVRQDEAALASEPEARYEGVPDEAPTLGALTAEYRAACEAKAAHDRLREIAEKERRREVETRCDVEDAQHALLKARQALDDAINAHALARRDYEQTAEVVAGLADPDLDAINARIVRAEETAELVRGKARRREVAARLADNRAHAESLTEQIRALEHEKQDAMLRATLPIPGLDCTGEDVTLNGIPVDQLNTALQIELGLAIGAAANPACKFAAMRDGSLLDDDTLAAVERWARKHDRQVLIERVDRAAPANGILICEGRLVDGGAGDE